MAVDVAPHRCPPIDPKVRGTLTERVVPPRNGAVDLAESRRWVDRYARGEDDKIAMGVLLMSEYETCRQGVPVKPTS